jgi:hypothetical protein
MHANNFFTKKRPSQAILNAFLKLEMFLPQSDRIRFLLKIMCSHRTCKTSVGRNVADVDTDPDPVLFGRIRTSGTGFGSFLKKFPNLNFWVINSCILEIHVI